MNRHLVLLVALAFFAPAPATAAAPAEAGELSLASIFSDHMVLQRDKPAPVWGWAKPGDEVTVEFAGQRRSGRAGADGKWMVRLDPLATNATPATLTVASAKSGGPLAVTDVLVGEVWLGSGQSNMAMQVSRAAAFDREKAAANLPLVRMFRESSRGAAEPQPRGQGSWAVCMPDTVGGFSATLFFFGREIQAALGVPVGLVNSSVGGTPIEAWVDQAAQRAVPELAPALASIDRRDSHAVGGLYNRKIAPLVPFAIRGVVWYQGEANAHPGKGKFYGAQLRTLVTDWRAKWGEELPFAWVQLPNYGVQRDDWMLVREGMLETLALPKTGMAITVDIGDPKDIHPSNKQDVGRRLAAWALADVYGKPVPASSGPLPAGSEIRGSEVVCRFREAEGLRDRDGGQIEGFVIAGADKQWKPARARIEGSSVVVSAADVPRPVAVRYAWAMNPTCDLVNAAGLPASPFRTDTWPGDDKATVRPNVIYIMSDELGYFEPGYAGNPHLLTPNIDRIATEGIRFTRGLAGSSVCAPTRCCFLTGKHSGHTSVRLNGGGTPLRAGEATIASILKPLGYATGGFGKWGNGGRGSTGVPEQHGFDVFFGYYDQVHAHTYYPPYLIRNSVEVPLPGNRGNSDGDTYSQYVIFDEAVRFIRANRDRPFFAFLPFTPPHGNFDIPDTDPSWALFRDKPWPEPARRYAAMVHLLDRQVGGILDLLDELGITDNTLVMFSGDNGGADYFVTPEFPRGVHGANKDPRTGAEFRGKKGQLYEGGLRVPVAARWPGRIAPGRVSDLLWYFPDVLPTIAEVCGAAAPADVDGISLVPELLGETAAGRRQPRHEYLYWELLGQTAVRQGDWKAIQPGPERPWELYDLASDVGERRDLSRDHPDLLSRLQAFAKAAHVPAVEGTFTSTELHERDRAAKGRRAAEGAPPDAGPRRRARKAPRG